jgi:hypothetical protein
VLPVYKHLRRFSALAEAFKSSHWEEILQLPQANTSEISYWGKTINLLKMYKIVLWIL